ncbi:TrmH family RNA methyltransferase [bacterium]|nr:TrmH family RNA methyltransferase [bacterium]
MGTYPTIDMLKYRKEKVLKVLVHSKAMESQGIKEILELCQQHGIRYEVSDDFIAHIAVKENTYAIGIFEKYEDELDGDSNHVVLDQPRNMGNIGTIVRAMVGFGIKDLAVIRPAADIFDPMIVRSAMGALFQVRFRHFDSYTDYLETYPKREQYLLMLKASKDIGEVSFQKPFSLVLGNESAGLPDDYAKFGVPVHIPHSHEIDSLNLSVAAGIALYLSAIKK